MVVDLSSLVECKEITIAHVAPSVNGGIELVVEHPTHAGYQFLQHGEYNPATKTFTTHIAFQPPKEKSESSFRGGALRPKDLPPDPPFQARLALPENTERVVMGEAYECFNGDLKKVPSGYMVELKWKDLGQEDWDVRQALVTLEENPERLEKYFRENTHRSGVTEFILEKGENAEGKRVVVGVQYIPKEGPVAYIIDYF